MRPLALALLGLLPMVSPLALAQDRDSADQLSDAVRRAQQATQGSRILSAERIPNARVGMSRVKVVDPQGRVQVMIIEDRHSDPRFGSHGRFESDRAATPRSFGQDDRSSRPPGPPRGGSRGRDNN